MHFPPAAHFSCTGAGRGEARTQKLSAVSVTARLGLTSPWRARLQTEWRRGDVSFLDPLHPSPCVQTSESRDGGGCTRRSARLPSAALFSLPRLPGSLNPPVSDFLALFPPFSEISHPRHQLKASPFCYQRLFISIK